ncbi:MAG: DmsC/YnfH family molybdoenzyme membrane anchor subunit [Pseudomonadota bacterium]
MHPPPSMIVFTVLTGLGLGLMATIGLGLGGQGTLFGWIAVPVTMVITAAGGAASLGHLGRPDRAWRAFTQWRSSWLSREAVLMLAAMSVFFVYACLWLLLDLRLAVLGWLVAALAIATIYSTAMIYAQLRTVPRWSGTPTPWLFLALGSAGGLIANGALAGLTGTSGPGWWVLAALIIAAGTSIWWTQQAAGARRNLNGSTMETATGLTGRGEVRMLEPPHTGTNYLLREMAYQVGRARAFRLRQIGALLGFILPLVLVLISFGLGGWVLVLALLCHVAGVLALRWLFFAEAEHVQALYYGMR